jgi:hypothetical protein
LGGVSVHERSHGESFIDIIRHRFYSNGFYLRTATSTACLRSSNCGYIRAVTDDLVGWPVCLMFAGFGYIAAGSIIQRSGRCGVPSDVTLQLPTVWRRENPWI